MAPSDDIPQMFDSESQKLESFFDAADSKTVMTIHEIVEAYYQVMNVSSMATMLKEQTESEELIEKIKQTEKLISTRFDCNIHLKIMDHLSTSIKKLTKNLQSENSGEKSKEQTESDAKLFDELRQMMSTREFAGQYGKGISND